MGTIDFVNKKDKNNVLHIPILPFEVQYSSLWRPTHIQLRAHMPIEIYKTREKCISYLILVTI